MDQLALVNEPGPVRNALLGAASWWLYDQFAGNVASQVSNLAMRQANLLGRQHGESAANALGSMVRSGAQSVARAVRKFEGFGG